MREAVQYWFDSFTARPAKVNTYVYSVEWAYGKRQVLWKVDCYPHPHPHAIALALAVTLTLAITLTLTLTRPRPHSGVG